MRRLFLLPCSLVTLASAQTQPIKVQTPDVPIPPRIDVPTLGSALAPLTSEEAVRLALRLQPAIENARGQLESAGGRTRQTASNLGPQVGATGTLSRTDRLGGSGNVSSGTGGTGGGGSAGGGGIFTSTRFALT
ncbi:hypothetical protein EON82_22035, partial [bacterium]